MTLPKHNPDVYIKLAEANPFFSNKKIAELLGVDEASVRRAYKKSGYHRGLIGPEPVKAFQTVDIPMRHIGDIGLMADIHAPLYNWGYIDRFLDDCEDSGIEEVGFVGDFWHCDQYGNYFPKQIDVQADKELPEGNRLMDRIMKRIKRARFIMGNHDYRWVRGRNYTLNFVDAMLEAFEPIGDVRDRIEFSNLDHFYLGDGTNPENDWYVCHPRAYSRQPLAGARALTTIHNMNVACAHSHHCARGYGPNGIHQAVELGGFFDASRTAYLQASTSFPKWTNGYGIYQSGKLRLESPAWSK